MKKKVVIIGCGFAGTAALKTLGTHAEHVSVTVFEKKKYFDFLPLLPDIIGKRMRPSVLQCPVSLIAGNYNARLIREEISSINRIAQLIKTKEDAYPYDYLLIAGGSETNYYDHNDIEKNAYSMDSVDDMKILKEVLEKDRFRTFIIAGGGYTGVEIASHIWRYFKKRKERRAVVIVEKAPVFMGMLPRWMGNYVWKNLSKMGLSIMLDATVSNVEKETVHISNGGRFEHALVIWTAGVRTPEIVQKLECDTNVQGRIKVDSYLQFYDNCFAAGDCACVADGQGCLRMSVQNAITQGRKAAENIIRSINQKPLKKYVPFDPGYVIPLANNKSCGKILGIPFKGFLPTCLHYFMCIFRTFGFKNKMHLAFEIIKKYI